LYVLSITQHNVTMPVGPSESKVFKQQDRAQFTDKWKAAVSREIWTILSR